MKFEYLYLAPLISIFSIVYLIISMKNFKSLSQTIEKYWFFKPKKQTKLSHLLYIVGVIILVFSLLDLRGEAEKHESQIPKQKTIILLDTSLSMIAEDVRPTRFKKAVLLARHIVKKMAGHSISVILFSDTHKRLVPFTSDIDLLDSRISGLDDLRIDRGGTNLTGVLMESLSYLKEGKSLPVGNIILLTDAEDNELPIKLKVPDDVSIALVAVGTKEGGKIPIRGSTGMYIGSKRFQGKEVITKIDEKTISRLKDNIKYFKYWIANTYSLPTEDLINFLNNSHNAKFTTGEVISKPVLGYKIIALGLILIAISSFLKFGKQFSRVVIMLTIFVNMGVSIANEEIEQKEPELNEAGKLLLEKLKQGKTNRSENLKLAQHYLSSKIFEMANQLYDENIKENDFKEISNHAVTKYYNKDFNGAIEKYEEFFRQLENVQEGDTKKKIQDIAISNVILMLQQQKQQQKQQKQQDEKDQKESEDKKESGKDKKEEQKKQNQKNKEDEQEKKQQKQQQKKIEVPALLKQLVNDDRKLQGKVLDTTTHESVKPGERRNSVKKNW